MFIKLFVFWLSFSDNFDKKVTNKNIDIEMINDAQYGQYQMIKASFLADKGKFFSAVCHGKIGKGDRQKWTFKLGTDAKGSRIIIGVVDSDTVKEGQQIGHFLGEEHGAYALCLNALTLNRNEFYGLRNSF